MLQKSQIKFILYFILVFIIAFSFLYSLGLVPESIKTEKGDSLRTLWDKNQNQAIKDQLTRNNQITIVGEEPTRIVIEKIGVDSSVANPNTTNVATLDDYLLRGAVRYPGSGLLGSGNMFIFAHSTGYSVVRNQAFKAFNGLNDLQEGDLIKVFSQSKTYTYKVTSVVLVDHTKVLVEFGSRKNMLTLSTCNSFGQKGERYVIEADFVN